MKSSGISQCDLYTKLAHGVVTFRQLEVNVAVAGEGMSASSTDEVTSLLRAWCEGDPRALEKLVPLVYRELHKAAHRQMARERSGHTLQTTGLVNEVYLRLIGLQEVSWQNRSHFLAVCAKLMRQILTDYARTRRRLKRGGGAPDFFFDSNLIIFGPPRVDLLALDDALTNLATFDQRKSKVVELRFFGGLTAKETAEALGVSTETVHRDWKVAKVWLLQELSVEQGDGA
jgi:RNA polymerase sigma-70 factor (ECF subfamily)